MRINLKILLVTFYWFGSSLQASTELHESVSHTIARFENIVASRPITLNNDPDQNFNITRAVEILFELSPYISYNSSNFNADVLRRLEEIMGDLYPSYSEDCVVSAYLTMTLDNPEQLPIISYKEKDVFKHDKGYTPSQILKLWLIQLSHASLPASFIQQMFTHLNLLFNDYLSRKRYAAEYTGDDISWDNTLARIQQAFPDEISTLFKNIFNAIATHTSTSISTKFTCIEHLISSLSRSTL
jgi:hypothetical protein